MPVRSDPLYNFLDDCLVANVALVSEHLVRILEYLVKLCLACASDDNFAACSVEEAC